MWNWGFTILATGQNDLFLGDNNMQNFMQRNINENIE